MTENITKIVQQYAILFYNNLKIKKNCLYDLKIYLI